MYKHICIIFFICIFPSFSVNTFAQSCDSFRACDNLGRSAKETGDLSKALSYYQTACFMDVKKSLFNLRNNACRAVTNISGDLDNYSSAFTFFNHACNGGKDTGCFHLALLEKDRGNLQLAMQMMKPLCDKKYIIHKNMHSGGCTEYEQMKREWDILYPAPPRQPRDSAIQIPLFIITLILPLIAIVYLFLKRYNNSLFLSLLSFICYGYYEYGVSPYASIRIDLLLIYPVLLANLAIFITSLFLLVKRKPVQNNK